MSGAAGLTRALGAQRADYERREARFPLARRLMREREAPLQEQLGQIAQAQADEPPVSGKDTHRGHAQVCRFQRALKTRGYGGSTAVRAAVGVSSPTAARTRSTGCGIGGMSFGAGVLRSRVIHLARLCYPRVFSALQHAVVLYTQLIREYGAEMN